jgi:hypothetical protein
MDRLHGEAPPERCGDRRDEMRGEERRGDVKKKEEKR